MRISAKDVIVILAGAILLVLGVWVGIDGYTRVLGAGIFLVGVGTVALGATQGFIDSSPPTAVVSKLGVLAYILGVPALAYGLWRLL